jgi:hypothetical protein
VVKKDAMHEVTKPEMNVLPHLADPAYDRELAGAIELYYAFGAEDSWEGRGR